MDLKELRSQIDQIDQQLVDLFVQRMDVASKIADQRRKTICPFSSLPGSGRSFRK